MRETEHSLVSVRGVLFGEGDFGAELTRSLREESAIDAAAVGLGMLSNGLRDSLTDRLGDLVGGLLDLDVLDVLRLGWQKHQALRAAAHRTLNHPGVEEIVELATHRMRSIHAPRVDVFVDDVHVATVHFEIELSLDLHVVNAVVTAGRLVALTSGEAEVVAKLSCENVPVKSESRQVHLQLALGFEDGIDLVEQLPPAPIPPSMPAAPS